ncbi:MAG: Asp23/Gls24 family envelope stress response protein [Peptococcaceae bacterium]|jgi:uncharacterized alkaline shock family protein YloU|nr:Asp23/Gls24 family envelope stress response protein [Peptococcaceae bacterium]
MPDKAKPEEMDNSVKDELQGHIVKSITGMVKGIVLNTDGVVRLYGWVVAGAKQPASGVRISIKDEAALVDIHIVVGFGKSIPEIARQIQNEVTISFHREFSDYHLTAVNVWVDGIRFNDESFEYREQAVEALE